MVDSYLDDKLDRVDDLTKVFKRDVVVGYIELLISRNIPFDVCILDIDNFKYINDGYGHLVGDKALIEVAEKIGEILGDKGVVGRYGGDEFIMVVPNVVDYDEVWEIWHSMLSCTQGLRSQDMNDLKMTVTMGSSRFPKDSTNIDGLFELADKALYRGKMKGRNCFIIYIPEKHANIDLKTERDKIVSSMYLHSRIYNTITEHDIKSGVKDAINYVGNYLMLDHLCLDDCSSLYLDYYHPICKKRGFTSLSNKLMTTVINQHTGIFYKNLIDDNLNQKLNMEFLKQNVYSTFIVELTVHGKFFGYLRADVCENPRGRIWQNLDMDVLLNLGHVIALELYYQNKEIKDLK